MILDHEMFSYIFILFCRFSKVTLDGLLPCGGFPLFVWIYGHGFVILGQNVLVYIVYILVRRQSFVHIASYRGTPNKKTSVAGLLLLLGAAPA